LSKQSIHFVATEPVEVSVALVRLGPIYYANILLLALSVPFELVEHRW
jgi:hypothetical protein